MSHSTIFTWHKYEKILLCLTKISSTFKLKCFFINVQFSSKFSRPNPKCTGHNKFKVQACIPREAEMFYAGKLDNTPFFPKARSYLRLSFLRPVHTCEKSDGNSVVQRKSVPTTRQKRLLCDKATEFPSPLLAFVASVNRPLLSQNIFVPFKGKAYSLNYLWSRKLTIGLEDFDKGFSKAPLINVLNNGQTNVHSALIVGI